MLKLLRVNCLTRFPPLAPFLNDLFLASCPQPQFLQLLSGQAFELLIPKLLSIACTSQPLVTLIASLLVKYPDINLGSFDLHSQIQLLLIALSVGNWKVSIQYFADAVFDDHITDVEALMRWQTPELISALSLSQETAVLFSPLLLTSLCTPTSP